MEGSRTYIHTSVDLFKAQRDSKAFETCWKTLRKTSSNWCVSRSIVFEVGVVFKNVSESGWVSELQLFFFFIIQIASQRLLFVTRAEGNWTN